MNKRLREIFSSNLRYYMNVKDMSRQKLADKTGIAYTTIRDYEKGICYAKMEKIEKIAVELGIPTYKLTDSRDNIDIMNLVDNSEDKQLMLDILKVADNSEDKQLMLDAMTFFETLSKEKKQTMLNTLKMIYNDMQ